MPRTRKVASPLAGRGSESKVARARIATAHSSQTTTSPGVRLEPQSPTRTIVVWCPDWPTVALARSEEFAREHGRRLDEHDDPIALVTKGEVFACSPAARRDGISRGLKIREAQSRCPGLVVADYDPGLDNRAFEPVLERLESLTPGVQVLRPGMAAIRSRGPARFYGGEKAAALTLLDALADLDVLARMGIADGPFTAEQAARSTGHDLVRVVPDGGSAEFLAPLPVGILDDPHLVVLLRRLGIRTLGEFAALAPGDVEGRFGEHGALLHALAGGLDSRRVLSRTPPRELDSVAQFDQGLDRIDQIAFGSRTAADRFLDGLTAAGLVATAIRLEIDTENGEFSDRVWLHPRSFTAADVVDRIRWQLQGGSGSGEGLRSPVIRVRIVPDAVDEIAHHEQGLWGTAPDERIHHGLSRVQSMLGHDGVVTIELTGGRTLADRSRLVPWGDRPVPTRDAAQPWPGSLPTPPPTTVFEVPRPVHVYAPTGDEVTVDERGQVSGPPTRFAPAAAPDHVLDVVSWAGPWRVTERWWDADAARAADRFQVVDSEGTAWLLVREDDRWVAEARYD